MPAYRNFIKRLWLKDPKIFKSDSRHQKLIANRLGWLNLPYSMEDKVSQIEDFVREVREEGFNAVVLLGMGGSSLASLVIHNILGVQKGYPEFFMLDSTSPDSILDVQNRIDLKKTLFIVASKSGTTIETLSHYKYFYSLCTGNNFIAITDEGTPLQKLAEEAGFRRTFINPSDVGGRFSGLSYFGMVPAGLMGIDIGIFLKQARHIADACKRQDTAKNPGLKLGLNLSELAKNGVDKLTFIIEPSIYSLGYWIEQLVAESTGKENKGIIPIVGERLKAPYSYHTDRAFIYIRLSGYTNRYIEDRLAALKRAGFAVLEIVLKDKMQLGAEFFKWEFATCVAAALLDIDPFDEPNVKESKDNTNAILSEFLKTEKISGQKTVRLSLRSINEFLSGAKENDYVAILIFSKESSATDTILKGVREYIRKKFGLATIVGYGPRYLHSTGQLFKGGPDTGLFIYLKSKDSKDLKIPGERYTFCQLKLAQELGDIGALRARGRRVIRFDVDI